VCGLQPNELHPPAAMWASPSSSNMPNLQPNLQPAAAASPDHSKPNDLQSPLNMKINTKRNYNKLQHFMDNELNKNYYQYLTPHLNSISKHIRQIQLFTDSFMLINLQTFCKLIC
jgi:hypothetical protein